jgi:RecJ-like exonuclease
MACECIRCSACDGTGHYFTDMRGQFASIHRQDDMHNMETCEECRGTGIEEVCYQCQLAMDEDYETTG